MYAESKKKEHLRAAEVDVVYRVAVPGLVSADAAAAPCPPPVWEAVLKSSKPIDSVGCAAPGGRWWRHVPLTDTPP